MVRHLHTRKSWTFLAYYDQENADAAGLAAVLIKKNDLTMIEQLLHRSLVGFKADRILDVGPGYNNFSRISTQITGATHITYVDNNAGVMDVDCFQIGS